VTVKSEVYFKITILMSFFLGTVLLP
jgi:hypothetical protein